MWIFFKKTKGKNRITGNMKQNCIETYCIEF